MSVQIQQQLSVGVHYSIIIQTGLPEVTAEPSGAVGDVNERNISWRCPSDNMAISLCALLKHIGVSCL